MNNVFRFGKTWQVVVFMLFLVLVATIGAGLRSCLRRQLVSQTSKVEFRPDWENSVELVEDKPDTVRVLPEAVEVLGLRTEVLQPIRDIQRLELSGTLAMDPGCRSYVHARFAGEIVEVGPVRPGDRVTQGDLLAALWSRELGEKKGELINALAEQHLDQQTLDRLSGSAAAGDRSVQEAQRKVTADRLAVARAIRTLETWRIAPEDIETLRREATELADSGAKPREKPSARLARWEIRAPWAGVVLEANAILGETVDAHTTLFRIADLARLQVTAQLGEEDLPKLDILPSDRRTWQIRPTTDPEAENRPGRFERIGGPDRPETPHRLRVRLGRQRGRHTPGWPVRYGTGRNPAIRSASGRCFLGAIGRWPTPDGFPPAQPRTAALCRASGGRGMANPPDRLSIQGTQRPTA